MRPIISDWLSLLERSGDVIKGTALPDMSNYYTKAEIDSLLEACCQIGEAMGIVQIVSSEMGTDKNTSSTSYVNLHTLNLTLQNPADLLVYATAHMYNAAATYDKLAVDVDGAGQQELGTAVNTSGVIKRTGGLLYFASIAAGSRNVNLLWKTVAPNTVSTSPATGPDLYKVRLVVAVVET